MIGSGRMGKVYRAWQRSLEREVAIKFLRKSFLNDADAIERFIREARIVAQLRHPNILAVHGLPGWMYLTTPDREVRSVLHALAETAEKVRQRHDHNLAVTVINTYAKAVKRRG